MKDTFDISGTGKQVRDLLFIDDLIQCYFKAVKEIDKTQGQPFNIGGGYQNSLSLLELFKVLEEKLGIKMSYKQLPVRASDQKVFIADVTKAKKYFDWEPKIDKQTGVYAVIDWMKTL
jgi:CDP-paratose 2-epimerase